MEHVMMLHKSLRNHLKSNEQAQLRYSIFIKSGGFLLMLVFWLGIIYLDIEDHQTLSTILSDLIIFSILWGYFIIKIEQILKNWKSTNYLIRKFK